MGFNIIISPAGAILCENLHYYKAGLVPAACFFDLQSAIFPRGRYEVPIRAALAKLAVRLV